ncbi:hypothetical protein [Xanthomonas graminis]|uniref:Uncharacterized protein n=1 Tax=Xanthomonas graminis pv. poae TaxID=227946 RepID=A0A199P795_9XANT|nr:hypothetical protein [Xanthomonas translucens]OAX56865.1 hypothetical protein A6R73_12050 [Xanthomonas translucens pv. poae]
MPTAESECSLKNSPWLGGKGELVKKASEAACKEGQGISLSPWDRHALRNADLEVYDKCYAAQLVESASH